MDWLYDEIAGIKIEDFLFMTRSQRSRWNKKNHSFIKFMIIEFVQSVSYISRRQALSIALEGWTERERKQPKEKTFSLLHRIKLSAVQQNVTVDQWTGFVQQQPNFIKIRNYRRVGVPEEFIELALITKPKQTSIEYIIERWLINNDIFYESQKRIQLPSTYTRVDFFIEPNVCLYCDGDYWHASERILEKDNRINKELQSMGYKVIRISETEILNNKRPTELLSIPPPVFVQTLLEAYL